MVSITWIIKDMYILPKIILLTIVLKVLWDATLYYETPPSFIMKVIIMREVPIGVIN